MINNELRERILATYSPWVYGYKRTARALGLTRDLVRQVILTATKQRSGNQMTPFNPNDSRVRSAKSIYEDRDLSEYSTDAEKIAFLQDENRLLRALLVEYQKEFIPEALSEYPLLQSRDESSSSDEAAESTVKVRKPKRSLKKKAQTPQRSTKQLFFDALKGCRYQGKLDAYCRLGKVSRAGFYKHLKYHKAEKDTDIANNVIARQLETGYRVGILKTQALLAKKGKVLGYAEMERKIKDYIEYCRTKRVQASIAYRTPHDVMLDYQAALN